MSDFQNGLTVCIPTYRRPQPLARLLEDLSRQSTAISRLVIVDGDPASGTVPQLLFAVARFSPELVYVPSNHANLSYQRFLGWKAAAGCNFLLYLDDDLQLEPGSVERLLIPLREGGEHVVGTTAEFSSPAASGELPGGRRREKAWTRWTRRLGGSRNTAPGGLTPSGHRRPIRDCDQLYAVVGCLRGGAMAFRMSAVMPDCFCADLFAMGQRGWGLGEDVLLSRSVGARGLLLTSLRSGIVHPSSEGTPAFRRDAYGHGFATAYSRRLLNDHYRGPEPPRWSDRAALVRSYCAHALCGWALAILSANIEACEFACGYSAGAARGLLEKPTSRRLTPAIDWWADANSALAQALTFTSLEPATTCRP